MKIVKLHNHEGLSKRFYHWVEKNNLTFLSAQWLGCYDEKKTQLRIILNNNNEVIGGFNYFLFTKSLIKAAIAPPFTPHISLCYVNPAVGRVAKQTFDKDISTLISEYFSQHNIQLLQISLPHEIKDMQPFIWKKYDVKTKYTYLIDLSKDIETLKKNLSPEKRKSLNKTSKDQLTIQLSKDISVILPLVKSRLAENKILSNEKILNTILTKFSTSTKAFAYEAYKADELIACSFCIAHHNSVYYLFGGIKSGNKHHGAMVSCLFQSILHAKDKGYKYFDFEGSMNPNIERFFREFGGELTPYFSVEKINSSTKTLLSIKKKLGL